MTDKPSAAEPVDVEQSTYLRQWICKKLGLPESASVGDIQGQMHILHYNAGGYVRYIQAFKCDDKQGQIARQAVRIADLERDLAAAREENERLKRELDAAVEHHAHWTNNLVKALPGYAHHSGDLLHNLLCEIARLKAGAEPAGERVDQFIAFWHAQSEWSQATFGLDQERGPVGPLKHLAKEVQEALADPTDIIEFSDLLFLVFDSARRAGFTPEQLLDAANRKLAINKQRQWQKPTSDEPVEHVRATPPPPAVRCFKSNLKSLVQIWAMSGEKTGWFFGKHLSEPSQQTIEELASEFEEIPFPAALALLADRPAQQARLAAMQTDQPGKEG